MLCLTMSYHMGGRKDWGALRAGNVQKKFLHRGPSGLKLN